jgi:hypothetical protein
MFHAEQKEIKFSSIKGRMCHSSNDLEAYFLTGSVQRCSILHSQTKWY